MAHEQERDDARIEVMRGVTKERAVGHRQGVQAGERRNADDAGAAERHEHVDTERGRGKKCDETHHANFDTAQIRQLQAFLLKTTPRCPPSEI